MKKTALIAASLSAIIGAALLWLYTVRFEQEKSGGAPIEVLVATQDIDLGTPLSADMLGTQRIPESYVEGRRHIRAAEARRVINVPITSRVYANEAILWTDLAINEQRRDLSGLVRDGMRAITIRADLSASFGGLLRPGDRVDVLLTTEKERGVFATVPLMQNIIVLAAGQDLGGRRRDESQRRGGPPTLNQITLSVRLDQAQILALAQEEGKLTLVLRNPDDITIIEGLPERTTTDIVPGAGRGRAATQVPPPTTGGAQ